MLIGLSLVVDAHCVGVSVQFAHWWTIEVPCWCSSYGVHYVVGVHVLLLVVSVHRVVTSFHHIHWQTTKVSTILLVSIVLLVGGVHHVVVGAHYIASAHQVLFLFTYYHYCSLCCFPPLWLVYPYPYIVFQVGVSLEIEG